MKAEQSPKQSPEQFFEALFRSYVQMIYRYCRSLLGESAGEDVTSEVFAVAWTKVKSIPVGAERAWLFGVARRLVANNLRAAKRQRALAYKTALNAQHTSVEPDPAVGVTQADLAQRAVASLAQRDQELLWVGLKLRGGLEWCFDQGWQVAAVGQHQDQGNGGVDAGQHHHGRFVWQNKFGHEGRQEKSRCPKRDMQAK